MKDKQIKYAPPIIKKGWHRKACEVIRPDGISTCISTQSNNLLTKIEVMEEENKRIEITGVVEQVFLNGTPDGLASTLTTGHDRARNITEPKGGHKQMGVLEIEHLNPINTTKEGHAKCVTATYYKDRKCNIEGHHKANAVVVRRRIRKLTERECFRLMGVDDKDIDTIQQSGVSKTQQYKMAGNSIVVDVLYHIFRKMFVETQNESRQLTLF